ncbi:MAG: adenylyltransferase/cytidyltransferase family protein [Candidatus Asgardarchaeia archaeon]
MSEVSQNRGRQGSKRKKVLIGGTFDIIHPGHIHLIEYASKLGDLIVVVSRDDNSKRFKGRDTIIPEEQRLKVVSSIKGVKKAILGNRSDIFKIVEEVKPDIIVLGPDQKVDETELRRRVEKASLKTEIIRLKERYEGYPYCSTSSIVGKILEIFCKVKRSEDERDDHVLS